MKKLLSCFLVVFILLINVIPCYAADVSLSVGVSDYYVDLGEKITVSIKLSANSGLATLGFTVNFNPNEFEYVAASGKTSGIFGAEETFTPSNDGRLTYRGVATEPVLAGGTVLSFQLQSVKNGGVVSLGVTESLDMDGFTVAVAKSSVKLNCGHGKMNWTVTQEPSCVLYGKKTGVCPCGYTDTEELLPNDSHSFDESKVVNKPTCTKTGLEVGTCTACGKTGAQTVLPALGHTYSDWEVTKEPSGATMGIRERVCKTCGDKEAQMVAPTDDVIDEPTSEEMPTEPITEQPSVSETQPNYNDYFEIETEPTTEKKPFFGDSIKGSNAVLVAVTGLTVLIVGFLLAYLILLRRR